MEKLKYGTGKRENKMNQHMRKRNPVPKKRKKSKVEGADKKRFRKDGRTKFSS